jgi:hypothetical protein
VAEWIKLEFTWKVVVHCLPASFFSFFLEFTGTVHPALIFTMICVLVCRYVDLYRKLCHLENFCILNYTAIVKVRN